MTAADGEAEPLRVPRWVDINGAGGDAPEPDGEDPYAEDPDDPPGRPRDDSGPGPFPQDDARPDRPDGEPDAARWSGIRRGAGWHRVAVPWRRRLALAAIAVVLSLVSIFTVSLLTSSPDRGGDRPGPQAAAPSNSSAPLPDLSPSTPDFDSTPGESATQELPTSLPETDTAPPRASQQPRFGPVTFEAEAPGNALLGSASVTTYPGASGGSVVRNIGDWQSPLGDGFLRFEGVNVPVAGTYTLTLYHVNLDNERTRTALVTVNGAATQSITVTGGSTCCTAFPMQVELRKGNNTITFTNDIGHAPSVDRIVLSLP